MREILRSNDPVLLSFAKDVLSSAGIASDVIDQHTSAIEGSIGVFPRRLVVSPSDWAAARQHLTDADLGQWLLAEDDRHQ